MIKKENKDKVKTGAFVITGFVLFIISFTAMTSDESFFKSKNTYYTYIKESQGIMFGSSVSFSGIDVGHVSGIDYMPEAQKIRLSMKVMREYAPLITSNSLVSVKTQGALGDRFIYISPGEKGGTPIANKAFILADNKPDLIDQIGSKLSDLEQISLTIKKVDAIITNFSKGADFETAGKGFQDSLTNFAGAAATIRDHGQIKPTLDKLNKSLDAINNKKGSLGQLIYDPALYQKVMNVLGEEKDDDYIKSLMRKSIEAKEGK